MKRLSRFKEAVFYHATNYLMEHKSRRIDRKIVVFESDDWGSIRMPSMTVRESLIKKGVSIFDPNSYDLFDTLASNQDLERLIETLSSVKDKNGTPAKLTINCVTCNPDFEKIKESGFQAYFYEPFTETLKRYPHHDKSFQLWKEGIKARVFQPQFHGREHLNVQKWLRILRSGNQEMCKAFDYGMFSVRVNGQYVLPAFDVENEEDRQYVEKVIKEGMMIFEELFGFRSKSIIAPCYHWDDYVEQCACILGVNYIQGGYIQKHSPLYGGNKECHFLGEKNQYGQTYLTRNCSFEPSNIKSWGGEYCLNQIARCFKAGRPAIVSCHRLNFIGDLVPANRENNLKDFANMLKSLVRFYPDVEFMSSDELAELL